MNISNVLVPVDFSPPSRLAVNYAVSLARIFRAKLTLMHVVESPAALGYPFGSGNPRVEKEHREQAMRMLSALLAPEDQDDLDLQIVIKSGDTRDEIVSTIGERRADIVVMGTHGRGLFGRWLIGSITQGILRKVSIPILTVCKATRPMSLNRILFATDLCEASRHGFGHVLELAQMMRSEVVVVHATESRAVLKHGIGEVVDYISPYTVEEVRAKLAEFVAEGTRLELKIETAPIEGVPAEAILKAADDHEADLIVITVQRKGLVERTLLGTTAERVIREAYVPVLSIPAGLAAAAPDDSRRCGEEVR